VITPQSGILNLSEIPLLTKPLQFRPLVILKCNVAHATLTQCNAVVCGQVIAVEISSAMNLHVLGYVPRITSRSADVMVQTVNYATTAQGCIVLNNNQNQAACASSQNGVVSRKSQQ
jgi:hypothetical protein